MNENTGRLDRARFGTAHADTMYVQPLFDTLNHETIKAGAFAYGPCWGILDPGMTMEKHHHAMPEFYVFVKGSGYMTLGSETFPVSDGMAVNIPSDMEHEVTNPAHSVGPLVWVSIGLTE